MGLNIKNDETNRLAHELAEVAGESLTTAVTIAVRERLDRLQRSKQEPLSERLLKIFGDRFAYALAKTEGEPLLFKGDDFLHAGVRGIK